MIMLYSVHVCVYENVTCCSFLPLLLVGRTYKTTTMHTGDERSKDIYIYIYIYIYIQPP